MKTFCGWLIKTGNAVSVALLATSALVHADFITDAIPTGTNPYAVAVNPVTNMTYVANYGSGNVTVINGSTSDTAGTITVGSNPRAIAVNALTNKIYVANFTAGSVSVIDGASHTVTATLTVQSLPNAIAVNPATNKVYVTNYGSGSVSVINGSTDALDTTVTVESGPIAVCTNPVTNRVYIANSGSNNVTVINGTDNSTTTVSAGTTPYSVAANTVTNKIYVANQGSNNVTVIDGPTNGTTTIAAGTSPSAIGVNLVTDTVYVVNSGSNNVTVIDGASGTAVSTVTAGTNPVALAVNTTTNKVYVANYGDSSLSVIAATVLDTSLKAGANPNAVAVNTITNKIYTANYGSRNVMVIDGEKSNNTSISSGSMPGVVAVNPVTNKIYVTNTLSNSVTVIDGVTNGTVTVAVGAYPYALAVNPVTNKIYVVNQDTNYITVIDGYTNNTTDVVTDSNPIALVVNTVTNKIYVANSRANNITAIDGYTNNTVTIVLGTRPWDIAVNSFTNKIYVANGGYITIIDGSTYDTTLIAIPAEVVAVNPITNRIYASLRNGTLTVSVIDGATNTIVDTIDISASSINSIVINSVTNRIYIIDESHIDIINGNTDSVVSKSIGASSSYYSVAINTISNKVFVAYNGSIGCVIELDGATNRITSLAQGLIKANTVAVNPITNKIYTANAQTDNITIIGDLSAYDTKVGAVIDSRALPDNTTTLARPSLTGTALNHLRPGHTGLSNVFHYFNTAQNPWDFASITGNGSTDSVSWAWNWGSDSLQWGENLLCAVTLDSQATSTNNAGLGTSFSGNVSLYPIYRILSPSPALGAPALVSPPDDTINQPRMLTFSWNTVSGATTYSMQIARDSLFSSIVFNGNGITDTFHTIYTGLDILMSYYWRVKALNVTRISNWSTVWKFTTTPSSAPNVPTLLAPANGSLGTSINPMLSWNDANQGMTYTVQISTDAGFSSLTVNDSGITDTFHTITGLSSFALYYWRVEAVNTLGASGWSTVWNFITGSTAVQPNDQIAPRAFSVSSGSGNTVRYSLPTACHVSLKYYDLRGRLVATLVNATQGAGYYMLSVRDALPSHGTYVRVFKAGSFIKRELVAMVGR